MADQYPRIEELVSKRSISAKLGRELMENHPEVARALEASEISVHEARARVKDGPADTNLAAKSLEELEGELTSCLDRIKRDTLQAGRVLKHIKEEGRYAKKGCGTWGQYVDERLDIGRAYADNLIQNASMEVEITSQLGKTSTMPKPSTGGQIEPLRGVAPDKRAEVWEEAVKANDGKEPTRKQLREAVKQEQKREVKTEGKAKTAGEVLSEEDWKSLPSPTLTAEEEFAYVYPTRVKVAVGKLDPEEVAAAAAGIQRRPKDLSRELENAGLIADWFGRYRDALQAEVRKGIHAVPSGDNREEKHVV